MRSIIGIIALLTFFTFCKQNKSEHEIKKDYISFYVGTYTDGKSEGIYNYGLQKDGKLKRIGLVATSDNPSFLTKSKNSKFLLAVNEIKDEDGVGTIESYQIIEDSLQLISSSSTGGAHPCHVTINDSGYVLASNYSGGNVGLLKLNGKGALSGLLDVQQHDGSGITDRQKSPHAHSAWFEPNSDNIISVDLGTNELWFSKVDTSLNKLIPNTPSILKMAPGAGPRHLTFHPNNKWIYVLNELDCSVTLVQKNDDGTYEKSISASTLPKDYNKTNTCADIHITNDGKFLYASNRGHNSIVSYEVNPDNGELTLMEHQSTKGETPRNFSLSPNEHFLLVANQNTNSIVSFKRDKATGLLTYIDEIEAPSPICILF